MAHQRMAQHELDLADKRIQRRLKEKFAPFPGSLEEAAFALVGLEPLSFAIDDTDYRKRLSSFLKRKGHEVFTLICAGRDTGKLKSLEIGCLFEWGKEQKEITNPIPVRLDQQVAEFVRTGSASSAKLKSFVEEVCSNVGPGEKGRGGKAYGDDLNDEIAAKHFQNNHPGCRLTDFLKSDDGKNARNRMGKTKARKILGPIFKNRKAGPPTKAERGKK